MMRRVHLILRSSASFQSSFAWIHTVVLRGTVPVFIVLTGVMLAACSDVPEPVAKMYGTVQTGPADRASDSFVLSVQVVLNDASRQLDALADQVTKLPPPRRRAIRKDMATLRERRIAVRRDVDLIRQLAPQQAESMRVDVRRRLEALQRDLDAIRLRAIATRSAFTRAARVQLSELKARLTKLEQHPPTTLTAGRADDRAPVTALQARRQTLEQQVDSLRAAGHQRFLQAQSALARDLAVLSARVRAMERMGS